MSASINIYRASDYRININGQKIEFADALAKAAFFKVVMTLTALLIYGGFSASHYAGVIEVKNTSVNEVSEYFRSFLTKSLPTDTELSTIIPVLEQEKYDDFLPLQLLSLGYGSRNFNVPQATEWIRDLMNS